MKARKYHIIVLGKIWLPYGMPASMTYDIEAGKGPFQEEISKDPVTELDDLDRYVDFHTGDFSSLDDYEVTREIIEWKGKTRSHTFDVIKDWESEANRESYFDTIEGEIE